MLTNILLFVLIVLIIVLIWLINDRFSGTDFSVERVRQLANDLDKMILTTSADATSIYPRMEAVERKIDELLLIQRTRDTQRRESLTKAIRLINEEVEDRGVMLDYIRTEVAEGFDAIIARLHKEDNQDDS